MQKLSPSIFGTMVNGHFGALVLDAMDQLEQNVENKKLIFSFISLVGREAIIIQVERIRSYLGEHSNRKRHPTL